MTSNYNVLLLPIEDDKRFIFIFQKSQLSDPQRMARTWVWDFVKHDMFVEN
jgi:hypothetical protein